VKLLRRREKRAAVLGCGPAGLFAAHALAQDNWDVTIFSKKRRSEMFGAQYLHAPIPGLTVGRSREVHYRLNGTVDAYREKVYGRRSGISVSLEALTSRHPAWDIREAYAAAWSVYAERIINIPQISPEWVIQELHPLRYDRVVTSIPATELCSEVHVFDSQQVWAIGDAPERGVFAPYSPTRETVECDATREVGWYRASNIFGYTTMEWPSGRKPPFDGVAPVTKPISTDCDCFSNFIRVGRYGTWTKGVLSHTAGDLALKRLSLR
jgi:hypothetical protein